MSEITDMSHAELIRRYNEVEDLKRSVNNTRNKLKDEIIRRVQTNNGASLQMGSHDVEIQIVASARVKPIVEIEREFGEEWMRENRSRLTKPSESQRLKITRHV